MRTKLLALVTVVLLGWFGGSAFAQPEEQPHEDEVEAGSGSGSGSGSAEEEHAAPAPAPTEEHPAPAPTEEEHPGSAEPLGSDAEHASTGTVEEAHPEAAAGGDDEVTEPDEGTYKELPLEEGGEVGVDGDGEPYMEYDEDGDGKMEPEELAAAKEYEAEFAAIPNEVTDAELDKRAPDKELIPSLDVETFRKLVRLAKGKVLTRMQAKIAAKTDKRMMQFTWIVVGCSLLGFLLLFTPLFLRKKYPGQDGVLVKYSALAAVTFFSTVLLFGGVLYGMKTAQGKVSGTAPNIAIAGGFFDTLDDNAEQYIVMGKELFAPTLEQLTGKSDEQPAVALIANGKKIAKDAMVFVNVAKLFKKIDFLFSMLPIILLIVTILLFILSIKPTLVEIIKLPAAVASGRAEGGREVVGKAVKRVKGEMLASVCALGVLFVMSLLSGFVLGRVAKPALTAIIDYFSLGVSYLQFVKDASSTMVFLMLFSVIFFLVLNLVTLIVSMSFYLGKVQKIFQARFNDDVPLGNHARFWKWGTASVALIQLLPLVFVFVAQAALEKINTSIMSGVTDADQVSWTKIMLAGPMFLVVGFLVVFWAARGVKALVFLKGYKVAPPKPLAAKPAEVAA